MFRIDLNLKEEERFREVGKYFKPVMNELME